MASRLPGEGRYARLEREQRWLLREPPAELIEPRKITDRYVEGTTLRLRRVDAPHETVYKLAQKVRPGPASPERVKLTNIYLASEEYEILLALPGGELRKTRWRSELLGRPCAVDVFEGALAGLVLAEVELADEEARFDIPANGAVDVTDDDRFSGGTLAIVSPSQLKSIVDSLLGI